MEAKKVIRRQKKISQRQEKKTAEELGANVEANSGATKFGGADCRKVNDLRVECKFTEKDGYSLKLETLHKLRDQAIKGGLETPVFQLEYRGFGSFAIIEQDLNKQPPLSGFRTKRGSFRLTKEMITTWRSAHQVLVTEGGRSTLDPFARIVFEAPDRFYFYDMLDWNDFLTGRQQNAAGN